MHAKINGSFAPHFEVPNIIPESCHGSLSWHCISLRIEGILSGCFDPIFALIGTICNPVTAFILLFRMGPLNRNLIFLACLSLADTLRIQLILVYKFPGRGLPYLSGGRYWWVVWSHNEITCTLFRSSFVFFNFLVTFTFVITSLDRLLSLTYPKLMMRVTPKKAWIIMALIVIVSIALLLLWATDVGLVYDPNLQLFKCWKIHETTIWTLWSLLLYHGRFLQVLITTIINVSLTAKIVSIMRQRRKLQEGQMDTGVKMSQLSAAIVVAWQALFNILTNIVRCSGLLLVLVGNLRGDVAAAEAAWPLHNFGLFLSDLPSCLRWLFYVWRMPRFREHLAAILCCKQKK